MTGTVPDLAAKCAIQLAEKDMADAESVANLIESPGRRSETLDKLRPKPEGPPQAR